MKKAQKIVLVVSFFLIIISIISCQTKTYSLEVDDNITVNYQNLKAIKQNQQLTLTITIPEGKIIDYLLINNIKTPITENIYTFTITKNTVIKVVFKDLVVSNYFSLKLPNNVTANINDLTNIYKGTSITLSINEPEKRIFDKLLINNLVVTSLINNTYTFDILEDTIVTVFFKFLDDWQTTNFIEKISFGINLLNNKDDNLKVIELDLKIINEENITDINLMLNLDENKKIIESLLLTEEFNVYYNNEFTYLKLNNKTENNLFYHLSNYFLVNFDYHFYNINNIRDFQTLIVIVFDVLESIIKNYNNEQFKENIFLLKKDNNNKIFAIVTNDVLLNIKGLENYYGLFELLPDFEVVLEIYFDDYKLSNISFDSSSKSNLIYVNMNYSDNDIVIPNDLDQYLYMDVEEKNYNIHLNLDNWLNIITFDYLINPLIINVDKINYEKLEKFNISGLYLDEFYLIPLQVSDLDNDFIDIYIKWKE